MAGSSAIALFVEKQPCIIIYTYAVAADSDLADACAVQRLRGGTRRARRRPCRYARCRAVPGCAENVHRMIHHDCRCVHGSTIEAQRFVDLNNTHTRIASPFPCIVAVSAAKTVVTGSDLQGGGLFSCNASHGLKPYTIYPCLIAYAHPALLLPALL